VKELSVTMRLSLPDYATEAQKKIFIGNLTVTWRALVEDSLHDELKVPLVEAHKYVGDYSITESDEREE
jgi:hypothetical protein